MDLSYTRSNPYTFRSLKHVNDGRFLLPYSIEQQDLPELLHTNESIIGLLLRLENWAYLCAANNQGKAVDVPQLLSLITKYALRISLLIAVGVQVLEMTNREVASEWLSQDFTAKCSLCSNEDDEAMILGQKELSTPLRRSSSYGNMDQCLA